MNRAWLPSCDFHSINPFIKPHLVCHFIFYAPPALHLIVWSPVQSHDFFKMAAPTRRRGYSSFSNENEAKIDETEQEEIPKHEAVDTVDAFLSGKPKGKFISRIFDIL